MAERAASYPHALDEALGWVGDKLDDVAGTNAGRVEGVLVDSMTGDPVWLIVRLGRLGRRTAVPFEFAAAGVGHVWTPFPRDLIRSASELDPARGLDPRAEAALCEHFGIPAGQRRRAELEDRDGERPSAIPAQP